MKENDFFKGVACRESAGDESVRKHRSSPGISAFAQPASRKSSAAGSRAGKPGLVDLNSRDSACRVTLP